MKTDLRLIASQRAYESGLRLHATDAEMTVICDELNAAMAEWLAALSPAERARYDAMVAKRRTA